MRLGLMPFTSDWAVIELFWRGKSHLCSSFCRLEALRSAEITWGRASQLTLEAKPFYYDFCKKYDHWTAGL